MCPDFLGDLCLGEKGVLSLSLSLNGIGRFQVFEQVRFLVGQNFDRILD